MIYSVSPSSRHLHRCNVQYYDFPLYFDRKNSSDDCNELTCTEKFIFRGGISLASLLAVDLGVRTGLALYGRDGRLRWYRSRNFGTIERLRRGVSAVLADIPDIAWLVLEGGGELAQIWEREAMRRALPVMRINAELWRKEFLYPREQRSGAEAKQKADPMARRVILWSGVQKPTSLRHDAAEAILAGLWGVIDVGWLESLPLELRR